MVFPVVVCNVFNFCYEGVTGFDTTWIGWAGKSVPDEIGKKTLTEALAEKVRLEKMKFLIVVEEMQFHNVGKVSRVICLALCFN